MIASTEILLSDVRGIHLPLDFCEGYAHCLVHNQQVMDAVAYIIQEGIDAEGYYDAWDRITADAIVRIDGHAYNLYQDGDLFLIPLASVISWMPDEEDAPEPDYYWQVLDGTEEGGHYVWKE